MPADCLLFMAQPPAPVRQAMALTLDQGGWTQQLADSLSPPANWHQSLSHPLPASPELVQGMRALEPQITAMAAFTLVFRRLSAQADAGQRIHWAFHAPGACQPLADLVAALRTGLEALGVPPMPGHRPHVTVSYWAPHALAPTPIAPIAWRVDHVLLVECRGQGKAYHYQPLERWSLRPAPPGWESQAALF